MTPAETEVGLKENWESDMECCQDPLSLSQFLLLSAHLLYSFFLQNTKKHGSSSYMVLQSLGDNCWRETGLRPF